MKIDYSLPTFNPGDVDIRLQYISIMQMEKMIETGKMYLPEKDELQRMSNAWSEFDPAESMDDFIDKGMDAMEALDEGVLEKEIARFKTTMKRCHMLLGNIAFINLNSRLKRINNNLFDAFSYAVADLNDYEYLNLINKGQVFNEKYRMLFRDGRFLCKSKLRRNSRKAAESR